ncbi:DEAD/DEAH box helicase [Flavobacterium sp. NKUCC04_CG]|uniref:DEAD/DEAH box helicase n=1 Tax=Flavobacterium sp. NKUCC04_CG TaxID=2842121 RepID=UPI001C5AEDA6|nr:DEAD/DEAH box helicase [Flavobacterium sp. NKUCC04_CG]MBW3520364.1 DEAD/DEAH box helicase [Flavobacterium sp. NKUCC04_CG]
MQLDTIIKKLQIQDLNPMQKTTYKTTQNDQDVVLLSPTGSGKTLAFLFPVLRNLHAGTKGVQALILVPSRELALQIELVFKSMGTGFKINSCYGGHSTKTEENNFTEPPSVLVGTPGRIAFHVENSSFDTNITTTLVLDEFDKALEMGFQDDISYIIEQLTSLKQRILTSATNLEKIPSFAGLVNHKKLNFLDDVEIKPDLTFRKVVTDSESKLNNLYKLICKIGNKRTLIFCNHRDAVDRISAILSDKGIARESFHGGMQQDERERALLKFRNGSVQIFITTDLAARGLDIPEVENIIHYQLPEKESAFTHRNGRTARMNAKGVVYLVMGEKEVFDFIEKDLPIEDLEGRFKTPPPTAFQTVYISAGKKDKVNKVDIVGYLMKKGLLNKEDIGIIEVKDSAAYVAVKREKVVQMLKTLADQKIKNKKVKMEIAF